ncbi:MAG: hypothetical protein ACI83O_000196 [Patescibacteria group bacterium]|jgi:hypothetical protein
MNRLYGIIVENKMGNDTNYQLMMAEAACVDAPLSTIIASSWIMDISLILSGGGSGLGGEVFPYYVLPLAHKELRDNRSPLSLKQGYIEKYDFGLKFHKVDIPSYQNVRDFVKSEDYTWIE